MMLSVSRTALFSKQACALLISEIQEENEVHDEVLNTAPLPAHQIRGWILQKLSNTWGGFAFFNFFFFFGLPKVKVTVSLKF